jgi:5-hydroxyisourate hydrolase-like protein (transthyretin family)
MSKFSFALSILVLHFASHSNQAQPIQAQPGETKTGTATISGLVTLKGEPARGVVVILRNNETIRWPAKAPRARADENGRFSFTSVAAGNYFISAVAPGYVSPEKTDFDGRKLSVADGETVENVDLEIKRGGVITGRIIDSQGRPVIEEHVTLKELDENQGFLLFSPNFDMFRTDDRGVYRIYGLPAGRYLVSVGYAPSGQSIAKSRTFYPRVFYPNATSESAAKVIDVSEGSEATDVDITISDPKEGRNVSGRVVDADTGKPLGGVKIEVRRVSSDGGPGLESGPDGEFRVFGLLPGKYELLTESRFNSGFLGGPVIFDVSEGDASGIELKVRQGSASISGMVVIVGADDPKVLAKLSRVGIGAEVHLADPKFRSPVEIFPVRVNADGSFRINGLPAGKASISIQMGDWTGLTVARIEHNGAPADKGIEIDAGEQVTGVRIGLLYGTLTLHGEVKVVGGTLPDGYRIEVYARGTDQTMPYGGMKFADARGRFVIENLGPGEYEIRLFVDCPDPEISRRFLSVNKRVFVGSDNQQPVTFVVDLSRKEEDK